VPTDKSDADRRTTLYLTNNRSSQQDEIKELIRAKKEHNKGKKFKSRKNPPHFCKRNRIAYLDYQDNQLKKVTFSHIPCNSWTCPDCQMTKALTVKYHLRDIIVLNDLLYFLTLTLDPQKIPPEYTDNTHKFITKIFNHFITVIKRKKFEYFHRGKNRYYSFHLKTQELKLKYVWVIEFQKNGNAHLHILFNKFLPIDVICKVWEHVGGGVMMRIEKVKTLQGISNYITDYIVKGIKHDKKNVSYLRFNQRRYSVSRSCTRPRRSLQKAEGKNTLPRWVYNTIKSFEYEEKEIIL